MSNRVLPPSLAVFLEKAFDELKVYSDEVISEASQNCHLTRDAVERQLREVFTQVISDLRQAYEDFAIRALDENCISDSQAAKLRLEFLASVERLGKTMTAIVVSARLAEEDAYWFDPKKAIKH